MTAPATRADVYNVHARWCSGGCPRWLAAGAPGCMPYPCRCAETKADAPQWRKDYGDVTCWWRKKSTGALRSRCPCWGDERDGKPGDCCSWHMASPRYLDDRTAAFLALVADADRSDGERDDASMDGPRERPEVDPLVWDGDDGEPWGRDPARERKPFVRRWDPKDLVCPCDPELLPKGVHCPTCCQTFGNELAASMHRRGWTDPCRAPSAIVDVDTGVPLLQPRHDGVWALDWAANVHLWLAVKNRQRS